MGLFTPVAHFLRNLPPFSGSILNWLNLGKFNCPFFIMMQWSKGTHYCTHECLQGVKVTGTSDVICQGVHGDHWRIQISPNVGNNTSNLYAVDDSPRIAAEVRVSYKGSSAYWIENISFSCFPLERFPCPPVGSHFHQEARDKIGGQRRDPSAGWRLAFHIDFVPLSAFGTEGRYGYRFFVAFRRPLHELNDTDCPCQVRSFFLKHRSKVYHFKIVFSRNAVAKKLQ